MYRSRCIDRYVTICIDRDAPMGIDRDISMYIHRDISILIDGNASIYIYIYIHRDITLALHRSLSWARWIQFTPPHDPFRSHPPFYAVVFRVSLFFGLPHQNFVHFSPLFHAYHMNWGWLWIMKQLPPFSRHMFPVSTRSNKIFRLNWLKFKLTIPHVRRWTLFFLHSVLFLYY
jgi:hypothetical protein